MCSVNQFNILSNFTPSKVLIYLISSSLNGFAQGTFISYHLWVQLSTWWCVYAWCTCVCMNEYIVSVCVFLCGVYVHVCAFSPVIPAQVVPVLVNCVSDVPQPFGSLHNSYIWSVAETGNEQECHSFQGKANAPTGLPSRNRRPDP